MRRSLMMLGLLAALVLAVGCERDEPQQRHVYDPQLDGPPVGSGPLANPTLLSDQKRISSASNLDDVEVTIGDPTVDVQAVVQRLIDALRNNNMQVLAQLAGGEGGRQFQPLLQQMAGIQQKYEQLRQLVNQRIGVQVPQEIQNQFTAVLDAQLPLPAGSALPASADQLNYTREGDQIVVSGLGPQPVSFIRQDGQWVINIPANPQQEQQVQQRVQQLQPAVSFLDEAISGIETGQINSGNFAERMSDLQQRHLAGSTATGGGGNGNVTAPHEFDFGDN